MRFLFFILFSATALQAQECQTFRDYLAEGNKIEVLDSIYPSALSSNPDLAVFVGREQEFQKAWVKLLQDLGDYLQKNDFHW